MSRQTGSRGAIGAIVAGITLLTILMAGCGEASPLVRTGQIGVPGNSTVHPVQPQGPQSSQQPNGVDISSWKHWQGKNFAAFLPSGDWHPSETSNGVDIHSPDGSEGASYAFVSGGMGPYDPPSVIQSLASSVGLQNFQSEDTSGSSANSVGGSTETVSFTADAPQLGSIAGTIRVNTMSAGGGYGFDSYMEFAPVDKWGSDSAVLDQIAAHITAMPGYGR